MHDLGIGLQRGGVKAGGGAADGEGGAGGEQDDAGRGTSRYASVIKQSDHFESSSEHVS